MAVNINNLEDYGPSSSNRPTPNNMKGKLNQDIIQKVLDEGTNINDLTEESVTPLTLASSEGNIALVRALLEKGAEVNKPGKCGETPLYVASEMGHQYVVEILCDNGADVNQKSEDGMTPLLVASEMGHDDVVQTLLDKGANVNYPSRGGVTPLWGACKMGHLEIVEILLDSGADAHSCGNEPLPLIIAYMNKHFPVVRCLIARSGFVFDPNRHPRPVSFLSSLATKVSSGIETLLLYTRIWPLHLACMKGEYAMVKKLLNIDANMKESTENLADTSSFSYQQSLLAPLMLAIHCGHDPVVRLLLERGAPVNQYFDVANISSFLKYFRKGHRDMAHLLLEFGAYPNLFRSKADFAIRITPLFIATYTGQREIVQLLLQKGANIRNKGYMKEPNLFMFAYMENYHDILLDLIRKKEKSYKKACDLEQLFCIAYAQDHHEVVDACIESCIRNNCIKNEKHFQVIDEHLKKLKVVGLFDDVSPADSETLDQYEAELINIRAYKLDNGWSLYNVFQRFKDPYYLRNQGLEEELKKHLNSPWTMQMFPLFGQILRNRFEISKKRFTLLTKVSEILKGQEWWDKLPCVVQDNILVFLADSDLESLCGY